MKRLTALLLIFSLLFAVACGASDDAPGTVSEAGPGSDTEASYYACGPAEQSRESETEESRTASEGVLNFLSAEVFSSDRRAGEVSEKFRKQYNEFALELLRNCSGGESALVSPLSALIALQMVTNGAKGQTAEEMNKTLGGVMSVEELNQQLFNYWNALTGASGENAFFKTANAVWMTDRQDFKVERSFVDIINNTFDAPIVCAPFDAAAVDEMNGWVKDHTDGMIRKLLEYNDVNHDTIMVLLNAVCFEALWSAQYEESDCADAVFHGKNGDTDVTMMYSGESSYIKGDHETGFYKYYRGLRYAFLALLPEEGMSMEEYLASLDGERFAALIQNSGGMVRAGIPQFAFDWSDSLVPALQAMGIKTAFTDNADFSGLGSMEGGESLSIEKVLHKTHIEVYPNGTKAAAATAVEVVCGSVYEEPGENKTVILDRPFVCAIFDTRTSLPVFIGCINDIEGA